MRIDIMEWISIERTQRSVLYWGRKAAGRPNADSRRRLPALVLKLLPILLPDGDEELVHAHCE